MAEPKDIDAAMADDYDEEADSDFEAANASDEIQSSSAEEEGEQTLPAKRGRTKGKQQARKKQKEQPEPLELDSGDEATIQELKKASRKQKGKGDGEQDDQSDFEEQGWRARTRAMREKEQVEKKKSRLASVNGSTVDVDRIWEAMNSPGGVDDLLKPTTVLVSEDGTSSQKENVKPSHAQSRDEQADENPILQEELNEMITIDETYEFAGEVHSRKKKVLKSSAEAKLWLSQRSLQNTDSRFAGEEPVRRPLRKISRFDPNLNNLDSFKKNWEKAQADGKGSKVQKLNTVEKSKMDWAAHVDQEGLQDELSEHAKAKGGYLSRMDFLGQVEQRKEEEARRVRLKG
jgi:Bucentaur or craniofacial development